MQVEMAGGESPAPARGPCEAGQKRDGPGLGRLAFAEPKRRRPCRPRSDFYLLTFLTNANFTKNC